MAAHNRGGNPRKEHYWRRQIERWHSSGMSVSRFCRSTGFSEGLFHYWRRTIAERDEKGRKPSGNPFVPVRVPTTPRYRSRMISGTRPGPGGRGSISGTMLIPSPCPTTRRTASVTDRRRSSRITAVIFRRMPSSCPQNASRDGKKSWRNSTPTRRAKSLSEPWLSRKHSAWHNLQKRDQGLAPLATYLRPFRARKSLARW
jgi:hypothetical protein